MKNAAAASSDKYNVHKSYWLKKLSGQLTELNLFGVVSGQTEYQKATLDTRLPDEISDKLLKIVKNNDLSLYVFFMAVLKILIFKYTSQKDIIIACPPLKNSYQSYNKFIFMRDILDYDMVFKELLMMVKETVANGYKNQNYPLKRLTKFLKLNNDLMFSKIIVLLKNIHEHDFIEDGLQSLENEITFELERKGSNIELNIIYNSTNINQETVFALSKSINQLLVTILENPNIKLNGLDLLSKEEKNRLIFDLCGPLHPYLRVKTIEQLFEKQVEKFPGNIALASDIDLETLFTELDSLEINSSLFPIIEKCCFIKNPYLYESEVIHHENKLFFKIIKTEQHNQALLSINVIKLLNILSDQRNLKSIFNSIKGKILNFFLYSIQTEDVLEVRNKLSHKEEIIFKNKFKDLVQLFKSLYKNNLIKLVNFNNDTKKIQNISANYFISKDNFIQSDLIESSLFKRKKLSKIDVLLLGDTVGRPSVGLLYLASYLMRNNVKACCQFYDVNHDYTLLKANIIELLRETNPGVVAISMKWFLHMKRVIEICKIVKEFSKDIKVVLGGDTASFYSKNFIAHEYIDYIVRGDGELPLLNIFKGEKYLPNCTYKMNEEIIENPISYVQDETSYADIYLSHLDEILMSKYASILGNFYIFTQKGCGMNCFYCAGYNDNQRKIFNRANLNRRGVEEIRKDIVEAKRYFSSFLFEFDDNNKNLLEFCKKIWNGIDLSGHFCTFTNLFPPSVEIIEYACKTFKYVYWNLDVASLSEQHRKKLFELGLVKPQPFDAEIIRFFENSERFDNNEIRFNFIAGLPHFDRDDIEKSKQLLSYIMNRFNNLGELHWARLHAQPGTKISVDPEAFDMHSYASTYEDFLKYSEMNLLTSSNYPSLEYSYYPYIYFNDDELNSEISKYYHQTNHAVANYLEGKKKNIKIKEKMTYSQLNMRANQLAKILQNQGAGPQKIVGLLLYNSIDLIVAMLATLKSGAAYLPIDPDYPPARKAYIIKDSGLNILVTSREIIEKETISNDESLSIYTIMVDESENHKDNAADIEKSGSSDNLLYVIYTSGSTGRPKGTLINHRNLSSMCSYYQKLFNIDETSRSSQVANLSFDAMAFEVWPCLLSGASLYISPKDIKTDPQKMKKWLVENKIDISFQATVMVEQLIKKQWPLGESSLKVLMTAGDKLSNFPKYKLPFRFYNLYGPTEDTIWTSWSKVGSKQKGLETPFIGFPVGNKTLYIVGEDMTLLPVGVPGELCIAGSGLASGYLNSPEPTWEKFTEDPFVKGNRIYKTGDLVRRNYNSELEFIGRTDNQIKVGGYRIELEEVEAQLKKHESIDDAAVIAKMTGENRNDNETKDLYAYFVSKDGCSIPELKSFLRKNLPDYMIPGYFCKIKEIPLLSNGKLDRKALESVEHDGIGKENEIILPTDKIQKMLHDIWKRTLGREDISITDNFFMKGGDSIKLIQILSRLNNKRYTFGMKDIYDNPTIAGLAPKVKELKHIPDQHEITGNIPLTPVQNFFFQKNKIDIHHYNQSIMLYSEEGYDLNILKSVMKGIQEHHDALRITFKKVGDSYIQTNGGIDHPFSFDVFDLKQEDNRETLHMLATKIQASIDLEKGPLMKSALLHMNDGDRLLIVSHHLIMDAVSWRILLEDIEKCYHQLTEGQKPEIPLKTDSFKAWSEKLFAYANTESFLKEKSHWKQNELMSVPKINRDYENGTNYVRDTKIVQGSLEKEGTNVLLIKGNQAFSADINTLLLTSCCLGLKKTFGNNLLAVTLEGHGRENIFDDIDISRTVGWFTSFYPVVFELSSQDDLSENINIVKKVLENIPNKGIGYGILKYLTAEEFKKDVKFELEPQISFNYLGQFDEDINQGSFIVANESKGDQRSLKGQNEYEIDLTGMITDRKLHLSIAYNSKQYNQETITRLLENIMIHLNQMVEYCFKPLSSRPLPGDFTYKNLSANDLELIKTEVNNEIDDIYTLTPVQEGMLFHELYEEERSIYFVQRMYRIHGKLDLYFLKKSLERVISRHDILRTIFIHENLKQPLQIVLKKTNIDFIYNDITNIGGKKEKNVWIEEFKKEDSLRSFNLENAPLMRVSIIQLETEEYIMFCDFHHILMDGWCINIIVSEFFAIYYGFLENKIPHLMKVKQYKTYIKWLEERDKERSKNFWIKYLENFNEAAGIPKIKKDNTKNQGNCEGRIIFELNKETLTNLRGISAKNRITLNSIMQAIWGIILGKYSGSCDIVFGSVVSGRPSELEGVESIVGLFINTVPVRIPLHNDMTFDDLLKSIQARALDCEPFQYFSLAEIQSNCILKQNLFDNIFIYENVPVLESIEGVVQESGTKNRDIVLQMENIGVLEQTNYDLDITVIQGENLLIEINYNKNVYNEGLMEKIPVHFKHLIQQVIAYEEITLDKLDIISDEDREQILYEFNDTDSDYPKDKTIHQIFEEQVEKNPDNIAIVFRDQTLTYLELNSKANQLARLLRDKGIKSDSIVGIMLERSVGMIVGICGILKSGGAYLPINYETPENRIKYMLGDCGTQVLILQKQAIKKNRELFCKFKSVEIIDIDEITVFSSDDINPTNINKPENIAYIIFTSGTTGVPKGVLIQHHSIANKIFYDQNEYGIGNDDIIMQSNPFTFDVSVGEIFRALLSGAVLCLLEPHGEKDPQKIINTIERNKVTMIDLIPTVLNLLLDYLDNQVILEKVRHLKWVFTGAEVIGPDLVEKFNSKLKERNHTRLINAYGLTETTVDVLHFDCSTDYRYNKTVPIGKPIHNIRVFLLDKYKNLLPVGIPGELCIAGDGLARGYLNNTELTMGKYITGFVKDDEQIYRTGDIGKRLPDGNLEFLGRIDDQVKLRGFRIELGEIESQLLKHNAINEAVVISKENKGGEIYLCAYIIIDSSYKVPNKKDLREYLSKELPDYMIPSYFVTLDKIPLTPNGKIDRKALPNPEIKVEDDYTAPRNEIEEKLVEIWWEVLNIEREVIGVESNFFELGGHSLKATMMVAKIHRDFNIRVPLAEVFKRPNIRGLSLYIESVSPVSVDKYESIKPLEKREYYGLSSAQKRLYILQQMGIANTGYNIPFVLPLPLEEGIERLEEVCIQLIFRHESLRTSFEMVQDEPVQRIHDEVSFSLDYYETAVDVEEILDRFVRPFDLSKAPLVRVGVVQLKSSGKMLLFDLHHIINDGVSHEILTQEFNSLYAGTKLPNLRLQYRDYAVWQSSDEQRELIREQEKYWIHLFSGELPLLNLPVDFSRPLVQSFEGAHVSFILDESNVKRLKEICSELGSTLYMMILALFNILLSKLSGDEDMIVGTPIAGRRHLDLEKLIGMFVNTLAMRNSPTGSKGFKEFLKEVKERTLEAFENQEYPFEDLVDNLSLRRDIGRNPLFDVMFNLLNQDEYRGKISGNEDSIGGRYRKGTSMFDITLSVVDYGDRLSFVFCYCTKLFRVETIERFVFYFKKIIFEIVKDDEIRLWEIEILSQEEKREILYDFNDTETGYPEDKTIHQLFEEQGGMLPNNTAIVETNSNHFISYRELNKKANQLAYVLRGKGITVDHVVGIVAKRSITMFIGILSILKAGGGYLPIEPDYPQSRIQYILEDSAAKLLLTQEFFLAPFRTGCEVINLEDHRLYTGSKRNLVHVNKSDDLVYVLYTSGSTGNPKGVMVNHHSIVNVLFFLFKAYPFLKKDIYLFKTSYVFDVSISELFGGFIGGGQLAILENGAEKDPQSIINIIKRYSVSHINFVPSMFKAFLAFLTPDIIYHLSSLKYIFLAGEVLSSGVVKEFKALGSKIKLENIYGPTEGTIYASKYSLAIWSGEGDIPIGYPLQNVRIYIFNNYDNLQPVGVAGELCLSGSGLARGYLNRSDLTSVKFIKNPYFEGERLYRTGDVARWLPAGNIKFLGRIDHQVKIRGFRIELGEIESQLLKHNAINDVLVISKENKRGEKYLCAYIIIDSSYKVPNKKDLREYLSKVLPDYMIPSYFVKLDKFPLTPNGKINRKALPEPKIDTSRDYMPPRSKKERKLVEIWSEVLGIEKEKISIKDNFFGLGGNSLKIIQVMSKLINQFENSISSLFKYQTISSLSPHIKWKKDNIVEKIQNIKNRLYPRESAIIPDFSELENEYKNYKKTFVAKKIGDLNKQNKYKKIFITGATGYLGIYLIRELIRATNAELYLLVRGSSEAGAKKYLKKKLLFYFGEGFFKKNEERLKVVCGNLRENLLGIEKTKLTELHEDLDAIIHAAANVRHYGRYKDFYQDNVLGTKRMLDFARKGRRKDFHFISTMSIGAGNIEGRKYMLFNEFCNDLGQDYDNVYTKSKFNAEKIVLSNRERNLKTSIYRVGNLVFDSETGKFQENIDENAFYTNIKAFLTLGIAPEEYGLGDMTFVNYAARAIVLLMKRKKLLNNTFHIQNDKPVKWEEMKIFLERAGFKIKVKKPEEFLDYLLENINDAGKRPVIDKLLLHAGFFDIKKNKQTMNMIVSDRTQLILRKLGFKWPEVNEIQIQKMMEYCKKVNFL